jgi:HSP20 family protein
MKSLTPWLRKNGGPFDTFRQDMDDWTRRFFGGPLFEATIPEAFTPAVDVEETDRELVVKADLPGVEPKDLDISVSGNSLFLRGKKNSEHEDKGRNFRRVERFEGEFYRELPMPTGVDPDKISATCAKGVVTITVPKKPIAMTKRIAVKTE